MDTLKRDKSGAFLALDYSLRNLVRYILIAAGVGALMLVLNTTGEFDTLTPADYAVAVAALVCIATFAEIADVFNKPRVRSRAWRERYRHVPNKYLGMPKPILAFYGSAVRWWAWRIVLLASSAAILLFNS